MTATVAPVTPSMDAATLRSQWRRLGIGTDYGRKRMLARMREPRRLVCIGEDIHGRAQWMAPEAARAWSQMCMAATGDGIHLQTVSAFRSIAYQCGIVERKLARGLDIDAILAVNAAPGYSEHHSGRALDLTTPGSAALEETFETTAAFAWLTANAARFGYTLSYPRGNHHGIAHEPWHWCWQRR